MRRNLALLFMAVIAFFSIIPEVVLGANTFICTNGSFKESPEKYWGECVDYVRHETEINREGCAGEAWTCYDDAIANDYATGSEPRESAIVVFGKNPTVAGDVGHVGIVIGIGNDNITIRDSNWSENLDGIIREHVMSTNDPHHPILGYIYCDGEPESASRDVTVASQGNYAWETGIGSNCENGKNHYVIDNNGYGSSVSKDVACQGVSNICASAPSQQGAQNESNPFRKDFWIWIWDRITSTAHDYFGMNATKACEETVAFRTIRVAPDGQTISVVSTALSDLKVPHPPQAENLPPVKAEPLTDLRIWSVGVFNSNGNELNEQQSYLEIGQTYDINVYVISENEDCENGVDGDIENVETDIFYKISHEDSDGEWKFLERVYSRPSSLTEGEHHKESVHFTIPPEAKNMRVYFKAKADATGEVNETDEGNNWSYWQKEWYPVKGDTDLTIAIAQLVGQTTKINLGSKYRFEMAVQNIEADTPLVGIQSGYYLKRPGENNLTLIEEDGSDADELTSGRLQWENTPTDGYSANQLGIHEAMICADIGGGVPETDENNNCKTFSFEVIPAPLTVDFIISSLGFKEGTTIKKGSRVHPWANVRNIGTTTPTTGIRIAYYIDGKYRDDDGVDAGQLTPGRDQKESVDNDNIKLGDKGTRTLKVCADYQGSVLEINEGNNCLSIGFKVK